MTVVVSHLRKVYANLVAVDDLSFTVAAGSVFAFLGANGAGKSTTIGCITTTVGVSGGSIEVDGHDVVGDSQAVRDRIGVVFQSSLLDPLLTVTENLTVRAGLYGIDRGQRSERIQELSHLVGLESFQDRRYGTLSGGQKRRADIARALLHRPSVLFLDEPTTGLDPQSREQIWAAVRQLQHDHGTTIFLTTHYMEETERADQVCIIDAGRLVAEGTPGELRARYSSSILTVRSAHPQQILADLVRRGLHARVEADEIVIRVQHNDQAVTLINELDIDDFEYRHGTMDDVFLSVTKAVAA